MSAALDLCDFCHQRPKFPYARSLFLLVEAIAVADEGFHARLDRVQTA
jgi:hypothetical protein